MERRQPQPKPAVVVPIEMTMQSAIQVGSIVKIKRYRRQGHVEKIWQWNDPPHKTFRVNCGGKIKIVAESKVELAND